MEKMRMETEEQSKKNVELLEKVFPNCITEALDENGQIVKSVNFELLRQMLSSTALDTNESYEFSWVGKKACIAEANRRIRKTLRPVMEDSENWDTTANIYIEGDNLDALKLLQES